MNKTFQKVLPVILAVVGSGGVVATAVLSSKAGIEAEKRLNEAKNDGKDISKKEYLKTVAPCYVPTLIIGSVTIASVVTGTIISKKTEAALSATCVAIDQGYRKYKNKVKDILGLDKHNEILESIAKDELQEKKPEQSNNGKQLYWMEWTGFFYADPVKLLNALSNMNLYLNACNQGLQVNPNKMGFVTIGQILKEAEADILEEDIAGAYENYGWSSEYLKDIWNDMWIYFYVGEDEDPKYGKYKVITFQTAEPVYDPEGWYYESWEEQYAVVESDNDEKEIEVQMASDKEKKILNEKRNEDN